MSLAQILEKLLVSERPVIVGAGFYAFEFMGDSGRAMYMYVRYDYTHSSFGEWVIDGFVLFP